MHATRPLAPSPPRHPLEVHPLARLHPDGRLDLLQSAFPPLGPLRLVLWHPGREPAFSSVLGRLVARWRFEGPPAEGYVVLWVSPEAPSQPF